MRLDYPEPLPAVSRRKFYNEELTPILKQYLIDNGVEVPEGQARIRVHEQRGAYGDGDYVELIVKVNQNDRNSRVGKVGI
jgi:hypothetical protein